MNQAQRLGIFVFFMIGGLAGNSFGDGGLFSWLTSSPANAQAGTVEDASLTFRSFINGTDQIYITEQYFYFYHQAGAFPGQDEGEELLTYVNGEPRDVVWQTDQPELALINFDVTVPLDGEYYFSLEIIEGRGMTSINRFPDSTSPVAGVLMNDSQFEGGAWYEWRLHWSTSPQRPVEENQLYWTGYLYDDEGTIIQIQNNYFNFLNFNSESDSAGNAALVFGSALPTYPVDVSVADNPTGLQTTILEQPRPWNDYICLIRVAPPAGAPVNTQYELLLAWGAEIDPGPEPTPGPLPVADTENINTPAYFPDLNFRLAIQSMLEVPYDAEITPVDLRAFQGELELSNRGIEDLTGLAFFENITALNCSNIGISELDVSGLPALVTLVCINNDLSELDLSGNPALQYLDISNDIYNWSYAGVYGDYVRNHLQQLDLSNNPALLELRIDGNDLGQLDVASNPLLATLSCQQNELRSLDLPGNPALKTLIVSNFENYSGTTDHQGNQFTTLSLANNPQLERLYAQSVALKNINVSSLANLRELDLSNVENWGEEYPKSNELTNLDISSNPNLELLSLSDDPYGYLFNVAGNEISTLAIDQCPNLRILRFYDNKLRTIDVSGLSQLQELDCGQNQITKLDVSNNPDLRILICNSNRIGSLDTSHNPELERLTCYDCQLTALNVSQNPQLQYLDCYYNQLAALDISNNPLIYYLQCRYNQLSQLDITHQPELQSLYCDYNSISEIDISQNTKLSYLSCESNQLTALDLSNNPSIYYLYCNDNNIGSLDLTGFTGLRYLDCSNNALTYLEFGNVSLLYDVDCSNNMLTEVPNVLDAQNLYTFDLRGNLLDEGDCPEVSAVFDLVGKGDFHFWNEELPYLMRGFGYTPQKDNRMLDCGLEPLPTPTPTPIPDPVGEQLPIAAGPEAVGIHPLTGDVNLWAENGGGSKYWRPEADTLNNGNAIVLGAMRFKAGYSPSLRYEAKREMRDMVAVFAPTGELIDPSRTAFFTDAGEPWPQTICTTRNDDKFLGLCADTVGGRNGARYVVHTIANPDAYPEAFPNYPPEQEGEYHTVIQVVSNDGIPETPLINPYGDYVSEPGLIRGGMVRFLSNGNIVVNFEDRTADGPAKEAFYGREGNRQVVGAVILGPDGSIVKPPFAVSNPSTSRNSQNRFGLTSGDGWFVIRYQDGDDGPTIVAFDNDGNELGGGEGRVYPAIDIPELQTDGGNRGDPNGLEAVGDKLYITHRGLDRRGYLTKFQVDETGITVLKTVQFTDHEKSTFEHNADLGVDSDGNVIVMWQDQSWERFQTGRWEMLARMFDSDLEPVTSSFCMFEVGSNLNENEVDSFLGPGRTKQGRIAMNDEIIIAIAETNEVPYGDSTSKLSDPGDLWHTYTFIARVLENPMQQSVRGWELY